MGATSPKAKKVNAKSLIAAGELPRRSVEVCLRPDLFAQMQDLERDLQRSESERGVAPSLASGSSSRAIAEQFEAVRQHMLDASIVFEFQALPRRRMAALQVEFPPRDGNLADAGAGLNIEEASQALVRRCLVDPVLDDEDWDALDEKISDGQWQILVNAVWAICSREVEVPFSRTASRILRSSEDA